MGNSENCAFHCASPLKQYGVFPLKRHCWDDPMGNFSR